MQRHDVNDLLDDLRHILHSEPNHQTWEELKARLYKAFAHSGELGEAAELYVRDHLERAWPDKYLPLLDFWIVCVAQEAKGQHAAKQQMELDRRVAYKRVMALSTETN